MTKFILKTAKRKTSVTRSEVRRAVAKAFRASTIPAIKTSAKKIA